MPFIANRRRVLQSGAALAAASALPSQAQENKAPLRIVVPLPAGGVADASVRFLTEAWTAQTKQTVVVDNRPGGNYLIGVQQLLNVPADGNTLIHLNPSMSATQVTFKQFDLTRQLTPVGMIGTTPGAFFVSAGAPYQSVREMLDWVRANPGKANFGATAGGIEHMVTATMLKRAGLNATLIPFKGGPDICTALAQNEIHFAITALPLIVPFKGRIRPLAVMSEQRSPMMPDVPAYRELGIDTPELNYWGALAAPAGTPAATIAQLNRTLAEVVKAPSVTSKYAAQGMAALTNTPEAMARIIADEVKWMGPVSAELNLKAA